MGLSSTAATIAAIVGGGLVGLQVQQGEEQRKAAKRSFNLQREAQRSAEASAITEREMASQQQRRTNRRQPNVAALLSTAQQAATTGPASTMLTGASGVTGGGTMLGRSSLLGQ